MAVFLGYAYLTTLNLSDDIDSVKSAYSSDLNLFWIQ